MVITVKYYSDYKQFFNSIDEITKPEQVIELDCSNNQLDTFLFSNIEKLINLKILNCSNNNLESLEGIQNLTKLEELFCSHNKLKTIYEIKNMINLKEIWCHNNKELNLRYINKYIQLNKLNINKIVH